MSKTLNVESAPAVAGAAPGSATYPCVGWRVHEWTATFATGSPHMKVIERGIVWSVCESQALWSSLDCTPDEPHLIDAEAGRLEVFPAREIEFSSPNDPDQRPGRQPKV